MGDQRFVEAVDAIYGTIHEPSRWPSALQKVADTLNDEGAILEYEMANGAVYQIASEKLLRSNRLADLAADALPTPKGIETKRLPDRAASFTVARPKISSRRHDGLRSPGSLAVNAIAGLASTAGAQAPFCDIVILLKPHVDRVAYSTAERAIYQELSRHASKAFHLSRSLEASEAMVDGLKLGLDKLGVAAIVLDTMKRITFANARAFQLIGDVLSIVDNRLDIHDASESEMFERVTNNIIAHEPGTRTILTRPILLTRVDRRPLVLHLLPVGDNLTLAQSFLNHPRLLILVMDPEAESVPDPERVRALLGVTAGEAKIATVVGEGASLRQAAQQLGIAE